MKSAAQGGELKSVVNEPRPSCPPVADMRQMTGRRATPANTDGAAFKRSHLVTLHHSDPCFLVKKKKRLSPILTCRIFWKFLPLAGLRSPRSRRGENPGASGRRQEEQAARCTSQATDGGAERTIGETRQSAAGASVSLLKYLPGVTPSALRNTDTKALRLL